MPFVHTHVHSDVWSDSTAYQFTSHDQSIHLSVFFSAIPNLTLTHTHTDTHAQRRKGGKKSVAPQPSVGLNWPSEREAVMDILCQLAELDPPLWDPPTPRMTEDCCK